MSACAVSDLRDAVAVAVRQGGAARARHARATTLGPAGSRARDEVGDREAAAAALSVPAVSRGGAGAAARRAVASALHGVDDRAGALALGMRAADRRRRAITCESEELARRESTRTLDDAASMGRRGTARIAVGMRAWRAELDTSAVCSAGRLGDRGARRRRDRPAASPGLRWCRARRMKRISA